MKHSRTWLFTTVILAALMFAMSQFYRASVAVISPDLMQEMGLNALDLSRISAAFFYAFAVMQIPVGIFLDTVGPRIAMTALTLLSVIGAIIFALGTTPAWLTFGRVLLGVGMACNFMGALKLLTVWFEPRQFATLSAVVVSLGTLGNIAAATPLVLMVSLVGWRHSFLVIAGFTFTLALVFLAVIKDRPMADEGGAGDITGGGAAENSYGADGKSGPRGSEDRAAAPADGADIRPSVYQTLGRAWALFHEKDYWIISAATFCRYGIYAAVQALWAGPFLIHVLELSAVTAGNILFLMSIGLILGCPLCGWLSDSLVVSRKKIIIPGICCMTGLLLGMNRLSPDTGVCVVYLVFFSFGLASGSGQVMYAHIKEQVPRANAGMAMTGINFFTMAGVAVFLQGMGHVMARFFPGASLTLPAFHLAFGLCSLCLVCIALLYCLTRETLVK
ncbi:MAG: MFS transporter [Desulfotignum sp.]|jgi:sugar phosphate permease|nr:MFS transporter [Desulfotignum sp.]